MDKFIKIGDAAKRLGVCVKTVAKLIDNGQLKGTRIVGGKHRKIRLQDFLSFCRKNAIDVEGVPKPPGPIPSEIDYRRGAMDALQYLIAEGDFEGTGEEALEFVSRYLCALQNADKSDDPKYAENYLAAAMEDVKSEDQEFDISF